MTLPSSSLASSPKAQPAAAPRYRPHGTMRQLWQYRGREVLVAGPAGTGKSRAELEKLDNCARLYPGMRALICRKLRVTLTQAALVTFNEKVLGEGEADRWFHHGDQEYRYPNGSRVVVGGLDDPEKIKSTEFDMVYVQEATELEEADWAMLLRGLRNGVMPYQQILADCNPVDPYHWLKVRCDAGLCLLLESRHEDNPSITAEYIATLDALATVDPVTGERGGYLYQRLRLGLWVAAQGMYFPEFNPLKHVVEARDIPADWPRWLSIDWGYADPFCCLWFARDPASRRIYVYRELYASQLRDEEQAQLIRQRSGDERITLQVGDPSMFNNRSESQRPSIAHIYWSHGVRIFPATNNRILGWQIVRRTLAGEEPRLQIMRERCPNLIRTLPAMVRDPLDPEDLADKVGHSKTEDHAVDSLRYGCVAEAQPPPPEVTRLRWG